MKWAGGNPQSRKRLDFFKKRVACPTKVTTLLLLWGDTRPKSLRFYEYEDKINNRTSDSFIVCTRQHGARRRPAHVRY